MAVKEIVYKGLMYPKVSLNNIINFDEVAYHF